MHLQALTICTTLFLTYPAKGEIRVEAVPEGGLQAEAAVDPDGRVHLVYLRGDPKAAEVRYTWRQGDGPWQAGQTLSSRTAPGLAIGSIRGPQLALGARGAVHVIWNGASGPDKSTQPALWYAVKESSVQPFGVPRDLSGTALALDGGGSVAADGKGGVYAVWHGHLPPGPVEETQRSVLVRTSRDEGKSFGPAESANQAQPGVCACCSLKAAADPGSGLTIFYRSAVTLENREMRLLSPSGAAWQTRTVDPWKTPMCPMSSAALLPWQDRLLGAWETSGQIHAGWLGTPESPRITGATSSAKHPALALSPQGKILLAWVEGTGWNRGGTAAWQELDLKLQPIGPRGSAPGVPAWGRTAVYAEPDGDFVVLK